MILTSALLAALLAALGATSAPASEDAGLASFYGGVPGPAGEFTAAHRSLPLGTRVRVTRVPSGRSVIVRINDRGPFVSGRIIDVSRRAADWLEMFAAGVVPVRVEVIDQAGHTPGPPRVTE
jgi:rare lipoprotein A